MMNSKLFLSVVLSAAVVAGCGAPQVASTVSQPSGDAALAADEAALGPDTVAPKAPGYAVQQMGGMMSDDGRLRLAMRDDFNGRLRFRFDDEDFRLRQIHPRLIFLFRRHPFFFHNLFAQRIFRLRPQITIIVLRRMFPNIDDFTLRLLLHRLIIFRNFNVFHPQFPLFLNRFEDEDRFDRD